MLDDSGFMRRSEKFEGDVSKGKTLECMPNGLDAPASALAVMDAGIATEANLGSKQEILSVQQRITASFLRADGGAFHIIRKATSPETELTAIYQP